MSVLQLSASAALCLWVITSFAQPTKASEQREQLALISEFARSLCDDVQAKGRTQAWDVSGAAKAKLSGVVKKLADAGAEGAVKYNSAEYEGLLQADVAKAIGDQVNCRLEIFRGLKGSLIDGRPKVEQPSPARRKTGLTEILDPVLGIGQFTLGMSKNDFVRKVGKANVDTEGQDDPKVTIEHVRFNDNPLYYKFIFRSNKLSEIEVIGMIFYSDDRKLASPNSLDKAEMENQYARYRGLADAIEATVGKNYKSAILYRPRSDRTATRNPSTYVYEANSYATYIHSSGQSILIINELDKTSTRELKITADNLFSAANTTKVDYHLRIIIFPEQKIALQNFAHMVDEMKSYGYEDL